MQAMTKSVTAASGLCRNAIFLIALNAGVLCVALMLFPASPAQANPAAVVKTTDKPTAFVPDKVTIKVGEEVEWDNVGKIPHRVFNGPPRDRPPGSKSFDSMFLLPGKKFIVKFTVPGTYKYVCDFHAMTGMRGVIVVTK